MPWNIKDKKNHWTSYNTEKQTKYIVAFLKEREEFLTIAHIEKHLKLPIRSIWRVLHNEIKTFSPETIEVLSNFLAETFGFIIPVFAFSVKDILGIISGLNKIQVKELKKHTKKRTIVEERQIAMFLYVELLNVKNPGYSLIGKEFGDFDHSTVSYAIKTVSELMEYSPKFCEKVNTYKKEIKKRLLIETSPALLKVNAEQ